MGRAYTKGRYNKCSSVRSRGWMGSAIILGRGLGSVIKAKADVVVVDMYRRKKPDITISVLLFNYILYILYVLYIIFIFIFIFIFILVHCHLSFFGITFYRFA